MKRPPIIGEALLKSVPATMAYFQLCRALRRNLRVKSDRQWLVAVHCHHERDIRPVSKACRFFLLGNQLSRQMNYFGDEQAVLSLDDVSGWKDKSGRVVLPRNAKDHKNLFMVCGPSDTLSADLALAADAVIRLGPPEESHLITALRLSGRGRPKPEEVSTFLSHDLQTLQMAFRRDRTVKEAVTSLSSIPKLAAAATEKKGGRTLEHVHGMGEAGEWGYRLAADLAAWKKGDLSWSDIESGILLSGAPGTGKTSFASALANTCGVHFVVGSYASWQASGHLGDMLASMKKAFGDAVKNAPAILFIDEIDAIGHRTSETAYGSRFGLQQQGHCRLVGAPRRRGVP